MNRRKTMPLSKFSSTTGAVIIAAVTMTSATVAKADGQFLGGLVTGVIGGALLNEAARNNKRKKQRSYSGTRTYAAPEVVQSRRTTQTSLNYFGFQAGVVDGVLGPQTRAAISRYQAYMGYPSTGKLTPYQTQILHSAHARGKSGGYETNQIISREGVRGLLETQERMLSGAAVGTGGYAGLPPEVSRGVDEVAQAVGPSAEQLVKKAGFIQLADLNGDGDTDYIIDTSDSGSTFWCQGNACKSLVYVSTASGYSRNDLMVSNAAPDSFACAGARCAVADAETRGDDGTYLASTRGEAEESLPLFEVEAENKRLGDYCAVTTRTDSYAGIAGVTAAKAVLGGEFCMARDHAIGTGLELQQRVTGATAAQIEARCAAFGKQLKPFVTAASSKDHRAVMNDVGGYVVESGMDPAQMITSARICLGAGYRSEDMATAMGSALLLVALGEKPYGELVGHHLAHGYGTPERPDLSVQWYTMALDSMDSGARAVFAPGESDRDLLLREATLELSGVPRAGDTETTREDTTLPIFEVAD